MSGCLKALLIALGYGLALFFAAVALIIYRNNPPNVYNTLARSTPASAETVATAQEGKLISVTGTIECKEWTGDQAFLKPNHHLKIYRDVEMYSWQKNPGTKRRRRNTGYSKTWTRSPDRTSSGSYKNPEIGLHWGKAFYAPSANIGSYSLTPSETNFGPDSSDFSRARSHIIAPPDLNSNNDSLERELNQDFLTSSRIREILNKKRIVSNDGKYLYLVKNDLSNFMIGDLRIYYTVTPDRYQATAFGILKGKELTRIGQGMNAYVLPGERREALINLKRDAKSGVLLTRLAIFILLNFTVLIVLLPFFIFSWFRKQPQNPSRLAEGILALCISSIVSTIVSVVSSFLYGIVTELLFLGLTAAGILLFLLSRLLLRRFFSNLPASESN